MVNNKSKLENALSDDPNKEVLKERMNSIINDIGNPFVKNKVTSQGIGLEKGGG